MKKPKIRFKGFTETWEQRKLGELVGIYDGVHQTPDYQDSGIMFLSVENIATLKSEKYIAVEAFERDYKVYPEKGDILMTRIGDVGTTNVVETVEKVAFYVSLALLKPNRIDSYFLSNAMKTNVFQKGLRERTLVTAIPQKINKDEIGKIDIFITNNDEEQKKIGAYFSNLDHLITLHQCKHFSICNKNRFAWEQRKLNEICNYHSSSLTAKDSCTDGEYDLFDVNSLIGKTSSSCIDENYITIIKDGAGVGRTRLLPKNTMFLGTMGALTPKGIDLNFLFQIVSKAELGRFCTGSTIPHIYFRDYGENLFFVPSNREQKPIGDYFSKLDNLITLHQHKLNILKGIKKYMIFGMLNIEGGKNMPELESIIEKNLIDQLVLGDSQWTYRPDLKSEKDLWDNFRYILEQNNKDRLNGQPLSDNEFEQVKNQLQFSSFYKAGEWLVGENGKVMIHVQRDTEKLHLVVMNHEHIAGGSSVYEVINQYSTLQSDKENGKDNNSRFDVTLMINGLPMIHIELKNKSHPYMEAFNQIKRYIGEGKFTGIFSAVQMFVVSNGVDTKYFSAASDTELNPKFMSGWLDEKNNPVTDYIDFAKSVLSIPQAHEMIARYTVLDEDSKRLILLRPYQIHAIEAIRESSKQGKSGYVWHTTGSGKTLTSYKATRNLLMDIPSIDKTIFLIDRKDLDAQTTLAFQAYANNDLVDVDETENVNDLKKKLKSDDRQVIVTTIQKLQRLVTKRLKEDTPEYNKIKNLKLGFIVDECHRAVTPATKRELERFFKNSLWFGFTGTPRFDENSYPQMGDLPRTTEALYGKCLHKYTIMNAIHDNAVLGFQVEHNGPKNIDDETDS